MIIDVDKIISEFRLWTENQQVETEMVNQGNGIVVEKVGGTHFMMDRRYF